MGENERKVCSFYFSTVLFLIIHIFFLRSPISNSPMDVNANEPSNTGGVNPSFVSSTGNYSVSQMYNSYYGPKRSFGTGWNIFGVPPGTNYGVGTLMPSRRNPSRTFPY